MLVIGMVTVFVILFLVIVIGNLIIWFVNKYVPEEVVRKAGQQVNPGSGQDPRKVAAIVSAVSQVTGGKGRVDKIEKQ